MSRFVTPKLRGALAHGAEPPQTIKDYAERVAKYVPAEVIAAYLAITSITEGTSDPNTRGRAAGLLFAAVFGVVITPIYLWKLAKTGEPWKQQSGVSVIAFIVWSYSMKGIWDEWDLYYAGVAGIALVVVSVVSGFYQPKEPVPDPDL